MSASSLRSARAGLTAAEARALREPEIAVGQRPVLLAVMGALAASGLMFEIALTRMFSLLFQYHFAFLAVSIALLGVGIGAAVAWGRRPRDLGQGIALGLALLAVVYPLTAAGLAWLPSTESILLHAALALAPFAVSGYTGALLFMRYERSAGWLYGADLIGAALGAVLVLAALGVISPFTLVAALGVAVGLAALGYARLAGLTLTWPGAAAGLALVLAGSTALTGWADFSPTRLFGFSRDKTMFAILRDPVEQARLVETRWDPFARVDVVETADPTSKFVFNDAGAGSFMLALGDDIEQLAPLRNSLEYIPFTLRPSQHTLVLGGGAGRDVALALLAGTPAVTAVEVNPAMVAVTRAYADYNGNIFDRPGVRVEVSDARNFVERSVATYDLIYLNLVYSQAAAPAGLALAEDYIFTTEAFEAYLSRLAPDGHLAIVAHNAFEGGRAALTALKALENQGLPPEIGLGRVALLMQRNPDPTLQYSILIVGQKNLTDEELLTLEAGIARVPDLQALFMPGGFEEPFRSLRNGSMTIEEFDQGDPNYVLGPTTDDRPYFFKFDPGNPEALRQALIFALGLAIALLLIALWPLAEVNSPIPGRPWLATVGWLSLTGLGFMLIEIPLIQRSQLLLGQPMLSTVSVLAAILLAGGLGSVLSQRWAGPQLLARARSVALIIVGLGLAYGLGLPGLLNTAMGLPLEARVALVVALTALIGFPLGMLFPIGLRLAGAGPLAPAGEQGQRYIGALWGVNGAFALLGSTSVPLIAMSWGFSWSLFLGVAAYLGVAGLAWLLTRPGVSWRASAS
jgi:hypothetical protein